MKNDFLTILKFNLCEQLGVNEIKNYNNVHYVGIFEGFFKREFIKIELIDGDSLKKFSKEELKKIIIRDKYIENSTLKVFIFDSEVFLELDYILNKNYLFLNLDKNKIEKKSFLDKKYDSIVFSIENILFEGLKDKIDEYNPNTINHSYNPKIQYKINNPLFTYILSGTNFLVFLILQVLAYVYSKDYKEILFLFAKVNDNILNGEYWRFITPVFMHSDYKHLFFNIISLIFLGSIVERLLGYGKFLIIYFMAGIYGNLLSFSFSNNYSVGASGAIFGLMGVLIFYGFIKEDFFKTKLGSNILLLLFFNIFYGLLNERIDNFGHFGGLISGYLIMGILYGKKDKFYLTKDFNIYMLITLTIVCFVEGFI